MFLEQRFCRAFVSSCARKFAANLSPSKTKFGDKASGQSGGFWDFLF